MRRSPSPARQVGALLGLALVAAAPLQAVEFEVNSLTDRNDVSPGDGLCAIASTPSAKCTLRAAIEEANALAGPDIITLGTGRYVLTLAGSGEDDALTGDLDILEQVLIQGDGADQTIVDAAGLDRVFHVQNLGADFLDLTVTGGAVLDSSGAPSGMGGGILVENAVLVSLSSVRVSDNRALAGGGVGAWHTQALFVILSEIVGNEIQLGGGHVSSGGALYSESPTGGRIDVASSTFSDNGCLTQMASECVGGLRLHKSSETRLFGMGSSTVSGNDGHGLSFGEAGGLILYSTVYDNTGYAIDVFDTGLVPRGVTAENTVFANSGIQDCFLFAGQWNLAGGHNLSSDNTCTLQPAQGDLILTDPDLHPLSQYEPPPGRIARTHHPRWLAPVIDAGAGFGGSDQDGFPRGQDGDLDPGAEDDIGAIEMLECDGLVLPRYHSMTITSGMYEACQTILLGPGLLIDGSAAFLARDSIELHSGVEVSAASAAAFGLARDAGGPVP